MNGLLIVNKPTDFTSFDVVAVLRKLCGTKKIGHTGTLDPMAIGVLPILIGSAAKAQQFMPDHDKEYIAALHFGIETDTLDITGKIISEKPSDVSLNDLTEALTHFRGNIMQVPPMYSAIKKDGKRLYELAREGITAYIPPRPVTIHELELLSFNQNEQTAEIRVLCSKGTYIRSICRDIGLFLGYGAVMTSLCRTRACGFSLEDSYTLEQLREASDITKLIIPTENLFNIYRSVSVTSAQAARFKNGGNLDIARISRFDIDNDNELIRVYEHDGGFIGLGKVSTALNELCFQKLF